MSTSSASGSFGEGHINGDVLRSLLGGRYANTRARTRDLMEDPQFWRDMTLGMDAHRDRVLEQMRALAATGVPQQGFPSAFGGTGDAGAGVVGFEDLVLGDPSLQVKAGVQWGLFASAIMHLGTEDHHERFLRGAVSFDVPGVFAMTEVGHGSNVAGLRTTATYDPDRGVFDLHTPDRGAWKDYLGNAAVHGRAAVVFAQLVTGGVSQGVHAFYVPIRTAKGKLLAGVSAEDDGVKGGLNGIDNGRLCFTHVSVPRENLLNRYGDVTEGGAYSSPIASPGRRFFTMLSTLVQGRVFLVGASRSASQLGLDIAVRYALMRRQFAMLAPGQETMLLDYEEHQRRLLPRLAGTYALTFLSQDLVDGFDRVFTPILPGEGGQNHLNGTALAPSAHAKAQEELETLAATVKPWATWHVLDVLQACREACGGAGFMAENRLVGLRADLDIYATFEGDNTVLLQLAARRLIGDYGQKVKTLGVTGLLGVLAGRVRELVWYRSGFAQLGQALVDVLRIRRHVGAAVLRRCEERELLEGRVAVQTAHLARVLAPVRGMSEEDAGRLVNRHQHGLVDLGKSYGDLLVWRALDARVNDLAERNGLEETAAVLRDLRDLLAASMIERNAGWFAAYGRLNARRLRAITARVDGVLLPRLRPHAGALVEAFGLSDEHRRAPLLTQ